MFGRTFAPCSGEQSGVFGVLFFTGARAARFPYPIPIPTSSLLFVHNSPTVTAREVAL